ncbi:MAG: hypothetical protein AAFX94_20845, partial [Myxococcota bacterium]
MKLALRLELRSLVRRKASLLALLGFLVTGMLAVVVGGQYTSQWQEAVRTAELEGAASAKEALAYLEAGKAGPALRGHANSAAAWTARGIASGAVDPAPAAFHIHSYADPMSTGGYRIENPELAAGAVDLVFVLAVLVPLLLSVLCLGIGGFERELGLAPLVAVQAGSLGGWWAARTGAVALVVVLAVSGLCLVYSALGGATLADVGGLLGLSGLYVLLWSGLILALYARAQTLRSAAFRFGLLWMAVCVLVPTLSAELMFTGIEADYAVGETLGVRALSSEIRDEDVEEVLPKLYALHPDLRALPAAADETFPAHLARYVHNALLAEEMVARHRARTEQESVARSSADQSAWASPAIGLGLA